MKSYLFILLIAVFISSCNRKELLKSGPMPGYSEMSEVSIWVQTTKDAHVKIIFWPENQRNKKRTTNSVITEKSNAYTAKLTATELDPGTRYYYKLYINGKQIAFNEPLSFHTAPIWRYHEKPPDFKFVMGSCAYINDVNYDRKGEPYGSNYEIFNSIASKNPDFMIWLGDNVYFRETDWNSRSGMINRYTHDRSITELQRLLRLTHHYAIWDDHDYGPNNSDKSFWNKKTALEVFRLFWPNPSFGITDSEGAISFFQYSDAVFFLLDNRYYRSQNERKQNNKTILGTKQKEWLFDALKYYSNFTFKFVVMGGQFLNNAGVYETYSNPEYGFEKERQEIIDFICKENIKNVIFISGDRHHSELSMMKKDSFPTIYDFTVSPLTSGPHDSFTENNTLRVDGSLITKRNFGMIKISGEVKKRKISFILYDSQGKQLRDFVFYKED